MTTLKRQGSGIRSNSHSLRRTLHLKIRKDKPVAIHHFPGLQPQRRAEHRPGVRAAMKLAALGAGIGSLR